MNNFQWPIYGTLGAAIFTAGVPFIGQFVMLAALYAIIRFGHSEAHFDSWNYWLENEYWNRDMLANKLIGDYFHG